MFLLRCPRQPEIRTFLEAQQNSTFSYNSVGSSLTATAPAGYVVDHNRVPLGSGEEAWQTAKLAICNWKMFDMPFVQLHPSIAPIHPGTTVAVAIHHFGLWSLNASRIVYVIDEPRRFGFAYGTLLDHAERGEERFTVEWSESDDSVWYDLYAFSRPHATIAQLAKPLARRLQWKFARLSMAAVAGTVRQSRT